MFMPLAKNIKKNISYKLCAVVFLTVIVITGLTIGIVAGLRKNVVIIDSGKRIEVKTIKSKVEDVLKENKIYVSQDDYISLSLDSKLQKTKENEIVIERAVPVNVLVDGKEIKIMTYHKNVGDAIESSPISIGPDDRFEGLKPDDPIIRDMNIKIVRVREEIINENTAIPYEVVSRDNGDLEKGVERVIEEGQEGLIERIVKVVFEDGKEVIRNMLSERVISNPISKIVEVGTLATYTTARGDTLRYRQVLDMRATAYSAVISRADPDNPVYGRTYTGMTARKGVIAVDPSVIPLGTKVYIEVYGNTPDYGFAVAGDIGTAIKGDLIDVCFDDYQSSVNWGLKRVKVYILAE